MNGECRVYNFDWKKTAIIAALLFFSAAMAAAEDNQTSREGDVEVKTDTPSTLVYPCFLHTPLGIHRGTPFELSVFLGNRTHFNNPQDLACTKLTADYSKINPGSDDWQLTVYGVNSGNSEIIYNPSMYSLAIFGREGTGDAELKNPIGITCNEYGDIYVADTGNNRVSRWYNDGKSVRFICNIGKQGTGPGEFNSPTYLDLDSAGRVYVSDSGNNRIQVFEKSGGFMYSIDSAKGIMNPQGILVCDSSAKYTGYKADCIYLIDGNSNRIQKLDMKGAMLRSIRAEEAVGREVRLTKLDMDYYGNIYVVDNKNSQVHKFSPDLRYITSQGKFGAKDYEFENPTGIAIYRHYGQVFVSDRQSAQYFWIGSDVKDFRSKKIGQYEIQFDFTLTEKGFATIEIESGVDAKNNTHNVKVVDNITLEAGKNSICWTVPEDLRETVLKTGGNYAVAMHLMATYSSYPYIEKLVKAMLLM
jgi:sugar lactone lactonase YvrE